ncbi:hypothetical protein A8B78_11150 [Jannaschia sp. EhC01]|nr:hypothetical protein A8B78_11150 [Jannaschia sp. EhC01]
MGIHDKLKVELPPEIVSLPELASILIVDDQRFDRRRLARFCRDMDFETDLFEADCLESMGTQLATHKFDLILMDYNLPDGSGLQALEGIRMSPKNRHAAVIMITGQDQSETAIEAMKRGCSDYITKNALSLETFRRAAINALQKSSLSIEVLTQERKRQQMEAVLQQFSTECAQEIKPIVSRMMRQLRDFKDAPRMSEQQMAEKYFPIEQSCMRLWDFLNDLDAYSGNDLAHEAFPGSTFTEKDNALAPQPNRASSNTLGGRPQNKTSSAESTMQAKPIQSPRKKPMLFGR